MTTVTTVVPPFAPTSEARFRSTMAILKAPRCRSVTGLLQIMSQAGKPAPGCWTRSNESARRSVELAADSASSLMATPFVASYGWHRQMHGFLRALTLADAHRLSAVYDAHYLTLAQLLGSEPWTDDR